MTSKILSFKGRNMSEIIAKIIYDNCKVCAELQEGWGFSALIEVGERKILFDTGNDLAVFFSNSKKMGIDLQTITDVIFSHKHHDHVTGCEEILKKIPSTASVYVPKGFPLRKIPQHLKTQTVSNCTQIGPNIFSIALRGGFFWQEQALILQTKKGLVVITGCAHPGILNILKTSMQQLKAPIYFVLGGFHLFRASKTTIDDIVAQFQTLPVKQVAPCHCSGACTIGQFQKAYSDDFHKIGTGTVLKI